MWVDASGDNEFAGSVDDFVDFHFELGANHGNSFALGQDVRALVVNGGNYSPVLD
jgi:hypothetical protein